MVPLRCNGIALVFGVDSRGYLGQSLVPDLPPSATYVACAGGNHQTALLRSDGAAFAFWGGDGNECRLEISPRSQATPSTPSPAKGPEKRGLLRQPSDVVKARLPPCPVGGAFTAIAVTERARACSYRNHVNFGCSCFGC